MICQRMMVGGGGGELETWSFTVNTEANASGEKTTGVPLNLVDQTDVRLTVDWGDGTSDTLTSSDYTINTSGASVHEYASPGVYQVTISGDSDSWRKTYLYGIADTRIVTSTRSVEANLYWFKRTLISVDSAFPQIKGMYLSTRTTAKNAVYENTFERFFIYCAKLATIPTGLFDNNTSVTNFNSCFKGCSSFTSIPAGFFDANTLVTSFAGCFDTCTSLQSIPASIFKNNRAVTTFVSCFYGCSSISSIPSELFTNNTAVTQIGYCFQNCTALGNFAIHIGSAVVSDCSKFVTYKSGASRTVYVPTGSTTQTNFNAVSSSLGLTIIGE